MFRADHNGRLYLIGGKIMFKFLGNYIKSKIFYARLKVELFKAFSHCDDYIELLTKLAIASKDMTLEEVKSEFFKEFAGIVHDYVYTEEK